MFEEKLERLLTLPNREWDEIQNPRRLRVSSLWKDFVELPLGIAKRIPSWVDWPFVIRGALRRLFGTPLLIEPLTDEEALIIEFALDMMNVDFPSPKDLLAKRKAAKEAAKAAAATKTATAENTAEGSEPAPLPVLESSPEPPTKTVSSPDKKRKAVKKGKRKVPAKRNKRSKVVTPETNVEPHASQQGDQQVEVDLSPSVSLLQDRETSVRIMRQLLSEADSNILNEGRVQNHLDDLLWDGLKVYICNHTCLNLDLEHCR